jgi:hypothetical protein
VSLPIVFAVTQSLIDDTVVKIPISYHEEIEIWIDPTIAMANKAFFESFITAAYQAVTIDSAFYNVVLEDNGVEKTYPDDGSAFWGYHFRLRRREAISL